MVAGRKANKRPSMFEVAKLAGVSHQTVSRVINNSPDVSTSTRAKVQCAIEQLDYRPSNSARALASHRSRREEALFAINVEAAKEIARQLRLRNISGMILVDFINLKKKEQQQKLISVIREELQKDSVPANFIDITRLGLVELTRKKVYKSLREILS